MRLNSFLSPQLLWLAVSRLAVVFGFVIFLQVPCVCSEADEGELKLSGELREFEWLLGEWIFVEMKLADVPNLRAEMSEDGKAITIKYAVIGRGCGAPSSSVTEVLRWDEKEESFSVQYEVSSTGLENGEDECPNGKGTYMLRRVSPKVLEWKGEGRFTGTQRTRGRYQRPPKVKAVERNVATHIRYDPQKSRLTVSGDGSCIQNYAWDGTPHFEAVFRRRNDD